MKNSMTLVRILLVALVALTPCTCSGGKSRTGDADTGTDPALDEASDTTVDPGPEASPDPGPDPTGDPTEESHADAVPDTVPDGDPDTGGDAASDPPAEPDAPVDLATDGPCSDPCYVGGSYVTGCTAMCGGFAGTPCPTTTPPLTCVYAGGTDAGICIPTANLPCSSDVECSCFPAFSICTGATLWSCPSGSCSLTCSP